MKPALFLILAAGLLASCSGSSSKTNDKTSEATVQTASATDNSKGSHITVTLTGGPNAGTYEASSKESTCSMGLTGEKSFGNQYSESGKGDKEFSSLQLIADDYDEAKKGTSNFNIMIGFGKVMMGASYSLDPGKGEGTGTIKIVESGSGRIATVEGKTKEGVGIKAVLTCNTTQKVVDGQLKEE